MLNYQRVTSQNETTHVFADFGWSMLEPCAQAGIGAWTTAEPRCQGVVKHVVESQLEGTPVVDGWLLDILYILK